MSLPMRPGRTPRVAQVAAVESIRSGFRAFQSVIASMATGCHARGQLVMRHDGSLVAVEGVCVGDRLMGPDSTPRTVLRLVRGRDEMFRIVPVKGRPWVVNGDHVLSLVDTRRPDDSALVDVSVRDWLQWGPNAKHLHKLVRVPVEFPETDPASRPLPAYHVGMLLGDGVLSTGRIVVVKPDPEIRAACEELAGLLGMRVEPRVSGRGVPAYHIKRTSRCGQGRSSPLHDALNALDMRRTQATRRVPPAYLRANRAERLQLLAGLIDTDGHLCGGGYDWISKSEGLAEDVAALARGLGFAAVAKPSMKRSQFGGGTYYRVSISGDLSVLPMRISRKRAAPRQQVKSVLRTGFRVEAVGVDDYFGFTVDGDHRYLLDDTTVTHNCGKGDLLAGLAELAARRGGRTLILTNRGELVEDLHQRCRQVEDAHPVGMVMGARDEWGASTVVASVQSVTRKRFDRMGRFSLVICDEAHHATAPTYRAIFEETARVNPTRRLLGLTATPFRTGKDGATTGLGDVFEALVYEYGIADAIEAGDLVSVRGFQVQTDLDLSAVRIAADGDYDDAELANAVDTEPRNQLVVDQYLQHGRGRPALVFAASIDHAQHIADAFKARGINAEAVWGDMPRADRAYRVKAFRDHPEYLPVLVSRDLLFEGFDAPRTALLLKARPTRSKLVFTQLVGRGLRTVGMPAQLVDPAERRAWIATSSKPECLFVDLVDNGCTLTLESVADLSPSVGESATKIRPLVVGDRVTRRHHGDWGCGWVLAVRDTEAGLTLVEVRWPPSEVHAGGTVGVHARPELQWVPGEAAPDEEPAPVLLPAPIAGIRVYELVGLMGGSRTPRMAWYREAGTYTVDGLLPRGGRIAIHVRAAGSSFEVWEVLTVTTGPDRTEDHVASLKATRSPVAAALTWAEEHLRALGAEVPPADSPWRRAPASGGQLGKLRALGRHRDPTGMSAGEASALIAFAIATRAIRKAEDPARFQRAEAVRKHYRNQARERRAGGGA